MMTTQSYLASFDNHLCRKTSPARQRKPDLRSATRTLRKRDIQNDQAPTLPPIGSISAISGTV